MSRIVCRPRSLTPAQQAVARRRAMEINPAAVQRFDELMALSGGRRGGLPRRLALIVGRRWPAEYTRLTVQFLDTASEALRKRVLEHMNAWSKSICIGFVESREEGIVRIARLDRPAEMAGYWSYVGTEVLGISPGEPTLNLEGFTAATSEREFRRVVRHEAGHTLGFDHEHLRSELVNRIDRRKAFAYFRRTEGWSKEDTLSQVLTPLKTRSIMGTTEVDPLSIMCYEVPGEITKDGRPILGGEDINERDYAFAASVYPRPPRAAPVASAVGAPAKHADFALPSHAAMPPSVASTQPTSAFRGEDSDALHIVVMDDPRASEEMPRFARVFASYGGARVTRAMRLRADPGETPTRFGAIIRFHERIKKFTSRDSGTLPTDRELVEFGTNLFETLFEGDVRRLYDEARSRPRGRKLDLVLTSMIPWIAEKPWEFAYDSTRRCFLATEEIHFVRNVLTAVPSDVVAPATGPLRILVAAAQPVGFGHLSIAEETRVIRRGFESLEKAGLAVVKVLARATPGEVHESLSNGLFNIVHFIGHGIFDEDRGEGALIFEDGVGGAYPLYERSAREIFCQRGVSLVFLNSCQSGAGGRADFNKGIAQSMVARGLPALVANQYSVLDPSATAFAKHFYWALAQGMDIGQAAREARIAVNYSMNGDPIDWAVPVVYARRADMVLCQPLPTSTIGAGLPQTSPGALAGASLESTPIASLDVTVGPNLRRDRLLEERRAMEVAAWDIDNVLPSLDETLSRMNAAQSTFGFKRADLSPPIDAWDVEARAKAPDGQPYLHAEKLARRMGPATIELRADVLACITRHWMRDVNTLNLYGWWPNGRRPSVLVLSCAGFGTLTDRMLANALVAALTGYLADMGAHERGAKDCPMYHNPERDTVLLGGRQVFDKACRRQLMRKLPNEVPALEALLRAFD